MANFFYDNSLSIGRTPLVRLNRINNSNATIFAKVDGQAFTAFLVEGSANGFERGASKGPGAPETPISQSTFV